MVTFTSLQMTNPRYPVSGPGIGGRSIKVERAEVNFATIGSIAIGDVVQLFKLHPKFRVVRGYVKIETAAAASSTYIIGDTGGGGATADDDRYFVSAAASAATTNNTLADTGRDFLASPTTAGGKGVYTQVNMTWAGAASGTAGKIIVVIEGFVEEPA